MGDNNKPVPAVWKRTANATRDLSISGDGDFGIKLNNGVPTGFIKSLPKIEITKKKKVISVGWTDQWDALRDFCLDYSPTGYVLFTIKAGDPVGKFEPYPSIDPSKPSSIPKKYFIRLDNKIESLT